MPSLKIWPGSTESNLETVSKNGGHLASNLGIVETTLAIHRVFNNPEHQHDVGHQCYTHKLLTGRQQVFSSLRQWNGISGFTNRKESDKDAFGAGHSGTSISAALGLAMAANQLDGKRIMSLRLSAMARLPMG